MICLSKDERKTKLEKVHELLDMQARIDEATSIIKSGLSKCKKPVIAFSGGKDSLVVLDLVRKINPHITGIFENTTNEYPETLRYIKTVSNIIHLHPEISFKECWKKYGIPTIKSKAKSHGNQCCIKLKEEPFKKAKIKYGWDCVFTGLTMDESRNRMMMLKRMGPLYFNKADKIWKCHPIYNWSADHVWKYIDSRNLPYNPIYDRLGRDARCGCRLCSAYLSWMKRTTQYNEKDTQAIIRMGGNTLLTDF